MKKKIANMRRSIIKSKSKSTNPLDEIRREFDLIQDPKKQQQESNQRLLQMTKALTSVFGAALLFTKLFSYLAADLNFSTGVLSIVTLLVGGILGYYALVISRDKNGE